MIRRTYANRHSMSMTQALSPNTKYKVLKNILIYPSRHKYDQGVNTRKLNTKLFLD